MHLTILRSRLFFIGALLVALYFAYTAADGLYRNNDLSEEEAALRAEVTDLQEQKAYLEGIRAYVATDAYVEHEARSSLGYVRPGEVPFVVVSPPAPETEEQGDAWWERLFPR